MTNDLTRGNITLNLWKFALPLMIGNLLQQLYNVADTLIIGRCLGTDALAAVGSAYTLMVFITSILLGLCMGSSAFFSIQFGRQDFQKLRQGIVLSFLLIGVVTLLLTLFSFLWIDPILWFMQIPETIQPLARDYLFCIFWGIAATFLYNFCANLLRAVGNSVTPLLFLAASALLNVGLDLLFVAVFHWGVVGAAVATVISQYISGFGILVYAWLYCPDLRPKRRHLKWDGSILRSISSLSVLTCVQQSVMNFGILMVQGRVNSFGTVIMAAFAAAVKIDSFAYMPVQDFGNAFSTFIAQNYGAGRDERIRKGIRSAALTAFIFCLVISAAVCIFAQPLMTLFVSASETEIIAAGVLYLRIEGAFYFGIGLLFLLYGLYRAVGRPGMSVVLTVISLGTRVVLAYTLSSIPALGVTGIWLSVPIGWFLADVTGVLYYLICRKKLLKPYAQD